MILDSHHHFWNYDPMQYPWIGDDMAAIRRDFGPSELHDALEGARIDGAISVQARQSLQETRWLLELARDDEKIWGVVGWVPLCEANLNATLEEFDGNAKSYGKLCGVRHVVQGEPDGFLERADFNAGIAALKPYDLVYDLLVVERQLPAAIAFVDRHPNQSFVLDHIAKPRIGAGEMEPWAQNIREMARRQNIVCKVSGLATETGAHWTRESLQPYFETVLDAFGPSRLMFGSDWPVCLTRTSYADWAQTVRTWTRGFSEAESAAFWGETAVRVYGL